MVFATVSFYSMVMLVLMIRGIYSPGSKIGIKYYFYLDSAYFKDMTVWNAAVKQCLYSTCVFSNGVHFFAAHEQYAMKRFVLFSSFTNYLFDFRFNNNVVRDSLIIVGIDTLYSIISGVLVFSFIGSYAKTLDVPLNELIDSGE